MKKYFVCIVLFFLIGGISAQAQVKFGLKAGVNMSDISYKLEDAGDNFKSENLTGFQVGPMLEFMAPLGLGLDLAVLYSQQGFKDSRNLNKEWKFNTLQIPVNLKLTIGPKILKVYGATGPNISLNLSDKLIDQLEDQSFGFGWNLGGGVELLKHLQVGVNYHWGLTNNYGSYEFVVGDVLKPKPRVLSFNVAYLF